MGVAWIKMVGVAWTEVAGAVWTATVGVAWTGITGVAAGLAEALPGIAGTQLPVTNVPDPGQGNAHGNGILGILVLVLIGTFLSLGAGLFRRRPPGGVAVTAEAVVLDIRAFLNWKLFVIVEFHHLLLIAHSR